MTLNLKNYKGFEKKPFCNAHCPQAKATTVADTPEIRRLAENTRNQSQAKYHEDFEKSKGKGFTAIADDPETLRIKNTSKIISNVSYHGELERKKQMEEKRVLSGPEEVLNNCKNNININNNNIKHQNRNNAIQSQHMDSNYQPHHQQATNYSTQYPSQSSQHPKLQQQQLQQQHSIQKQHQQLYKQQQLHYQAQDTAGQANSIVLNRHSQRSEGQMQQQVVSKHTQQQQPQQHPIGHPLHQQQQFISRQQQQQMMMQQQHRHSLDANMPVSRQPSKQLAINNSNPQVIMHQMIIPQQQQQINYLPDAMVPSHMISSGHQMIPPTAQLAGFPDGGQRVVPTAGLIASSQGPHHIIQGCNPQMRITNGVMPKQQQQNFLYSHPPRHIMHPSQIQSMNNQKRPQQLQHPQNQIPNRIYRAIYDYVANDVDEVNFVENDILIDCMSVDGNWLVGKVARTGQTGMLPRNYVTEWQEGNLRMTSIHPSQ